MPLSEREREIYIYIYIERERERAIEKGWSLGKIEHFLFSTTTGD